MELEVVITETSGYLSIDLYNKEHNNWVAHGDIGLFPDRKDERTIWSVGVNEAVRNRGVGELLMLNVCLEAVSRFEAKHLWLYCYTSNHSAMKLYNKIGFLVHAAKSDKYKSELRVRNITPELVARWEQRKTQLIEHLKGIEYPSKE